MTLMGRWGPCGETPAGAEHHWGSASFLLRACPLTGAHRACSCALNANVSRRNQQADLGAHRETFPLQTPLLETRVFAAWPTHRRSHQPWRSWRSRVTLQSTKILRVLPPACPPTRSGLVAHPASSCPVRATLADGGKRGHPSSDPASGLERQLLGAASLLKTTRSHFLTRRPGFPSFPSSPSKPGGP